MSSDSAFGKWRSRLWPVHGYELKKSRTNGTDVFFWFFLTTRYCVISRMPWSLRLKVPVQKSFLF